MIVRLNGVKEKHECRLLSRVREEGSQEVVEEAQDFLGASLGRALAREALAACWRQAVAGSVEAVSWQQADGDGQKGVAKRLLAILSRGWQEAKIAQAQADASLRE